MSGFASMGAISSRNFSTPVNNSKTEHAESGGDSIFASADYFKDVEPSEIVSEVDPTLVDTAA